MDAVLIPRYVNLAELTIDNEKLEVTLGSSKVDLTLIEFKILRTLITVHPELISRKQLIEKTWGTGRKVLPKTLNTHLSNLRVKTIGWKYVIYSHKNEGVVLQDQEILS